MKSAPEPKYRRQAYELEEYDGHMQIMVSARENAEAYLAGR